MSTYNNEYRINTNKYYTFKQSRETCEYRFTTSSFLVLETLSKRLEFFALPTTYRVIPFYEIWSDDIGKKELKEILTKEYKKMKIERELGR